MDIIKYEESVNRTFKSCATVEVDGPTLDLLHMSLGLSGEVGELVDTVKKNIFYGQEFDQDNAKEELGDILYCVTAMCSVIGVTLEEIMVHNKEKLEARYPDGYSDEAAKARVDKDTTVES